MKSLYHVAREQLIAEHLRKYPNVDESEAEAAVEHAIHQRMQDLYWERVDEGRQRAKDRDI